MIEDMDLTAAEPRQVKPRAWATVPANPLGEPGPVPVPVQRAGPISPITWNPTAGPIAGDDNQNFRRDLACGARHAIASGDQAAVNPRTSEYVPL